MSYIEDVRERIRERARALRERGVRGSTHSGQMRLGGGVLVEEARRRAESITARIVERKPGLIPMVTEWRPGERIRKILAPQTGKDMSVEEEPKRPADRRDLSVAM